VGLGFDLRVLDLQSRVSNTWATPPVHSALVILEMRSHELFVGGVLESQTSRSQPSK
jgi:hypothetical protein